MFKISYQKTLIIIQNIVYSTFSNAQECYFYENVKFGLYSIKITFSYTSNSLIIVIWL